LNTAEELDNERGRVAAAQEVKNRKDLTKQAGAQEGGYV
jgi:hypothetical protein